jgi:mono/diheme cytochrome c family protein
MVAFNNCGDAGFVPIDHSSKSTAVVDGDDGGGDTSHLNFANVVKTVLDRRSAKFGAGVCTRCHGILVDYEYVLDPSIGYVVPGKPESSKLYQAMKNGSMPAGGDSRMSDAEIKLVYDWIKAGAPQGSSAPPTGSTPNPEATYTKLTMRLFSPQCVNCHKPGNLGGGYDMMTYDKIKTRIVDFNPGASKLMQEVASGNMPSGGSPVSAELQKALSDWIQMGAPNN